MYHTLGSGRLHVDICLPIFLSLMLLENSADHHRDIFGLYPVFLSYSANPISQLGMPILAPAHPLIPRNLCPQTAKTPRRYITTTYDSSSMNSGGAEMNASTQRTRHLGLSLSRVSSQSPSRDALSSARLYFLNGKSILGCMSMRHESVSCSASSPPRTNPIKSGLPGCLWLACKCVCGKKRAASWGPCCCILTWALCHPAALVGAWVCQTISNWRMALLLVWYVGFISLPPIDTFKSASQVRDTP
ncbi:hypothetical protein V8C44DRAFT_335666 [Trichoderma aethiopicum]